MKVMLLVLTVVLGGCGTAHQSVRFEEAYQPNSSTSIIVGTVLNETGESFDIDVENMLRDALVQELGDSNLLGVTGDEISLTINTEILEYKKGDAFKRWLWPGYGSTVLAIRSEVVDAGSKFVGSVDSRHTVDAGGGYTIGAWKKIFKNVAKAIVADIQAQL